MFAGTCSEINAHIHMRTCMDVMSRLTSSCNLRKSETYSRRSKAAACVRACVRVCTCECAREREGACMCVYRLLLHRIG